MRRALAIVTLAALAAGLTGCSPSAQPAVTAIEQLPNVDRVKARVGQPGAPWNIETYVDVWVKDGSVAATEDTAFEVVKEIAATETGRHDISLTMVVGDADPDNYDESPGSITTARVIAQDWGLADFDPISSSIHLAPAEISRIAKDQPENSAR